MAKKKKCDITVKCERDDGGYNLYSADVTKQCKKLFGDVLESAKFLLMADCKRDAEENVDSYFGKEHETKDNTVCIDGNDLELTFVNGKKIKITNSEWCSMYNV